MVVLQTVLSKRVEYIPDGVDGGDAFLECEHLYDPNDLPSATLTHQLLLTRWQLNDGPQTAVQHDVCTLRCVSLSGIKETVFKKGESFH